MFRNTTTFKVSVEQALNKNVLKIIVAANKIGSLIKSDIPAYIARTFLTARKQITYKKYFIYAICNLKNIDTDEEKFAKSKSFESTKLGEFFNNFIQNINNMVQSDERLKILNVEYNVVQIPEGSGCATATSSREVDSILNKKSVIKIINDDNNCVWYALACLMYPNNKAIRDFRNTKARINPAKTLCNKCKFEWNKPVAIN